jgi:hypothetical protein
VISSIIEHLCRIVTPVSNNLLHHLTRLRDVVATSRTRETPYDREHPRGVESKSRTLSFERQRDAAKSELARRGNPEFDPSIYCTEVCW